MRIAALLCLVGCGHAAVVESVVDDDAAARLAREQARFDAEHRPDRIVEALALHPGAKVAEIGAGTGLTTVHLARAVAPDGLVIVTDIDKRVLDLLDQRIAAAGLDEMVEQRVVDPATPGLEAGTYAVIIPDGADDAGSDDREAGTYDAILLDDVIHFFADPAAWLRTAGRALRPAGRLVIAGASRHRERALAAGRTAQLHLVTTSEPTATSFIAVFAQ